MSEVLYCHYKANIYVYLHTAIHSGTLEKMAVYQRLNGETIWVRPLKRFEEFALFEGQQIPLSFQKIE